MKKLLFVLFLTWFPFQESQSQSCEIFFTAADAKLAEANYQIAIKHYKKKNYREALYFAKKTISKWNLAKSQYILAQMHYRGLGEPRDHLKAFQGFKQAAEQGHAGSQYMLAQMYARGEGTKQDYSEAVFWLEKATEKEEFAEFQDTLGAIYYEGQMIGKNLIQAYVWAYLAKKSGKQTKNADKYMDKIKKEISPSDLKKAQEKIKLLRKKIEANKQIKMNSE